MARKKLPQCFVAMAFGHHDTDLFFIYQILPILKKNKIKAVIINRRQSNDDLNIQIIEQIKLADMCIVDLTYARPSVYFEAGFAQQREIPVIYTARSDHLEVGQPDNLRVHFDLTMKPIITWDDIGDKTFPTRIERRIKSTFLNNWNKKQQSTQKNDDAESEFQKLPILARFKAVRQETIKLLKNSGFLYWDVYKMFNGFNIGRQSQPSKPLIYKGMYNHVFGHKVVNKKMYYSSIHSYTSPQKTDLKYMQEQLTSKYSFEDITRKLVETKKINHLVVTSFVLSLNNVTTSRIENTLQSIVLSDTGDYYKDHAGSKNVFGDQTEMNVNYVFLSGIKSTLQLKQSLVPLVNSLYGVSKKKN